MNNKMRSLSAGFLALISLSALSCFEEPVTETLRIEFRPEDRVALTVTVKILPDPQPANPLLLARVEEVRNAILSERDEWSRRFAGVPLESERFTWQKSGRKLENAEHSGVIESGDLQRFLSDTTLITFLTHGFDWDELAIHAGASRRASSRQRAEVNSYLDRWSSDLVTYFAAVRDLYSYLAAEPHRAEACLGALVSDVLTEEAKKALPEVSKREAELLEPIAGAMTALESVLGTQEGTAYSINELSYLVYDPFPARFVVHVPGKVLEVEGFESSKNDLKVRRLGLWDALESLEGRWISPDPFTARIRSFREEGSPRLDLAAFASRERRAGTVPAAAEIRAAIEERLRPPPVHRVRWLRAEREGAE